MTANAWRNHLQRQPIPEGFQIFEKGLSVAGLHYCKDDAIDFVAGQDQWLELRVDPYNLHDKNAIMVIGCWKARVGIRKEHIGYIPKEVAGVIVQGGFLADVKPRLHETCLTPNEWVEVTFQIIGPKNRIDEYRRFRSRAVREAAATRQPNRTAKPQGCGCSVLVTVTALALLVGIVL